MSKLYCYICRGDVAEGKPVAEDPVLSATLWLKKSLGISRSAGKTLVVCPGCAPIQKAKRNKFKRKLLELGLVAGIVLIAHSILISFFLGLIFAVFILSLSLIYYAPGMESEEITASKPA